MSRTRQPRRPHAAIARQQVPIAVSAGTQPLWRRHAWRLLLLWLLVLVAYSNSFESGLVFDNAPVIAEDPRIRAATPMNLGLIFTGGYWYNIATSGLYRPLTTLTYLVNYSVFGNGVRPAGYHWTNLAIHEANVALVYALGIAIFAEGPFALALAALWGLHPLLTESVTNIVGRADLLAAFGVLAGLWCYVRATPDEGRSRLAWIGGIALAQAIGVFSKESAVVLPAGMLLYDLAWPKNNRRRAWAYGAAALPIAAFFFFRSASHPNLLINFPENPLTAAGFWTARITAIKVIGEFIWRFIWPARLSADYSYNAVPIFGAGGWEDAKALLAAAICLGSVALTIASRRRFPPLFFFSGFFFVSLLPTANLIILIGSIMAERFMYLPVVGLAGCVVFAIRKLSARANATRLAHAFIALICLLLAARTYARNSDWRDGLSLWTSAVAVSPQAARAHNNLGYELSRIPGRLLQAIGEYQAALRIRPDYAEANYNLGNALMLLPGRLPDAIAAFQAATRAAPNYAEAHNNLGSALLQTPGREPDAILEFQTALRIRPSYAEAHNNLGNALSRMPGRLPDAISEFDTAARITPDYAEAYNNLGNALARMPGQLPAAIAQYRIAARLKPDYAEAHNNLGNALAQVPGRIPEAIAEYQVALRIRPDYPEAHANLGSAFLTSGRPQEAIAEYRTATRLDPALAEAHFNLANALLQIPGRRDEAIAEFEAAQKIKPDPEVRLILSKLRGRR